MTTLTEDAPWTGWTAQLVGGLAMLAGAGAVAALLAAASRLAGRAHR